MERISIALAMLAGALGAAQVMAVPPGVGSTPIGTTGLGNQGVLTNGGVTPPNLPPANFVLTVAKPSTDYAFLHFLQPAEIVADSKLYVANLTDDANFQSIAEVHWQALPDTNYLIDCDLQSKSGIVTVDNVAGTKLSNGHLVVAKKSSSNAANALSSTLIQIRPSSKATTVLRGCTITTVPTPKK